ncbi:uncharacterized protein LOC121373182 [Gigantopelta aegis]|uniref:uncharacterized protein LOC121373182 n=1 Tax=Gigantopelta aegis TaxID=1735272 RepID=UPI001B88915C|nr:uncharacterized protein LOC121373182 [Gigantopelta aegis]
MIPLQQVLCISGILTLVTGYSLYDIQGRSHRLVGSKFATETVKNFVQCKSLCERRSLCKSVNYNTRTRECTSNFHDVTTSPIPLVSDVPEVVYDGKSSIPQSSNVCVTSPCEDSQVCAQLGSGRKCFGEKTDTDCGVPPDVTNATKSYHGTSLNSVTTYSCYAGYVMSDGPATSTCEDTKTWSATNFYCTMVSCMVPTVANGTFIHQSTTLGSEGSVECDKYFRFFGNSSSAKCNATGHWGGLNGDCRRVEWRNMVPPFEAPIPWPLSDGWEMLLAGTPGTKDSIIYVDLMYRQDIYVRVEMRFNIWGDVNTTIFSASYNGTFIADLIAKTSNFPFVATVPFEMRTTLQNNTFAFVVDGADLYTYNILRPAELIDRLAIYDDVTIDKLLFIYNNTIY